MCAAALCGYLSRANHSPRKKRRPASRLHGKESARSFSDVRINVCVCRKLRCISSGEQLLLLCCCWCERLFCSGLISSRKSDARWFCSWSGAVSTWLVMRAFFDLRCKCVFDYFVIGFKNGWNVSKVYLIYALKSVIIYTWACRH